MAIDKESTGIPEFDARRRTTKVNLAVVIAVGGFYAIFAAIIWWLSRGD